MSEQVQTPSPSASDWMTRNITYDGRHRAGEDINIIRENLAEQAATDRKRMPERIFVGLYLPLFYEGSNKHYPQVSLGMWANEAGNEYREVDIYNAKGEFLYTVPPLFDRTGINSISGPDRTKLRGGNILNVIKNAELRSRVSPVDGTAFLNHHLRERALYMRNFPPSVRENILRWNAIFKRYGLNPLIEMEEDTRSANAVSNSSEQQQAAASNDDWEPL